MATLAAPQAKTKKQLVFLVMDDYETKSNKGKKNKNKTKSNRLMNAKNGKNGTQYKVDLMKKHMTNQKFIDKSRKTKRRLKNMESGLKTPAEEYAACNEADCVDFTIGMEKYEQMYSA